MATIAARSRVRMLNPDESRRAFDEQARRHLGMSGEQFLKQWRAGVFDDRLEDPEVGWVASLLALVYTVEHGEYANRCRGRCRNLSTRFNWRFPVSDPNGPIGAHVICASSICRSRRASTCWSLSISTGRSAAAQSSHSTNTSSTRRLVWAATTRALSASASGNSSVIISLTMRSPVYAATPSTLPKASRSAAVPAARPARHRGRCWRRRRR